MKKCIIIFLLGYSFCSFAKDRKDEHKANRVIEKEEGRFQKSIRKDPNSAIPYLEHANRLAVINTEAARAAGFYQLALKYDSANADIYREYGKYLMDRQRSYTESKTMLEKGLLLAPTDAEMVRYLAAVNKIIALQEEDARLRDFGKIEKRTLNPDSNQKEVTRFDSLRAITTDVSNKYNYKSLLSRYIKDEPLSPVEMYMLIVGYSKQEEYNPFSYNDISEMKMLAGYNIDSAISKGKMISVYNPLNPSLNREIMYYYRKKGDTISANIFLRRVVKFFDGVLYSGDGSCQRPYVSLWAKEEYSFINYLGYKPTENHAMGTCSGQMAEVIDMVNPVSSKTEPVHFNVSLIYMRTAGK